MPPLSVAELARVQTQTVSRLTAMADGLRVELPIGKFSRQQ
jgi:hypothetical protein